MPNLPLAIATLLLAFCAPVFAQEHEGLEDGYFDVQVPLALADFSPGAVANQVELHRDYIAADGREPQYLRVQLDTENLPAGTTIEIRGRRISGMPVEANRQMVVAAEIPTVFVSDLILGGTLVVTINGPLTARAKVSVTSVLVERDTIEPWSSVYPGDGDDRKNIGEIDDQVILNIARPVAFLSYSDRGVPRACTAFLVAPDVALTNNHCVSTKDHCQNAIMMFDFYIDKTGDTRMGPQRRCAELLATNPDLDYSLLKLDSSLPSNYSPLALASRDGEVSEPSFMIQHPKGGPKKVARVGCQPLRMAVVGAVSGSDFTHRCDTEKGSSGSPVVAMRDGNACVIGLHHWSFAEEGDFVSENRAVRSSLILGDLRLNGFNSREC